MVNKRISKDHPLGKKVMKGELKGNKACSKLVEGISFDDKGMINPKNPESIEILATFQRVHNSWFQRFNFNLNTQDFPNTDFYDSNEMGYHFTWVLFKEEKLSNVLTKKRSFKGIRESEKDHRYFIDRRIRGHRQLRKNHVVHKWKVGGVEEMNSDEYLGPIDFWEPELTQFGTLVGLGPYKESPNKMKKWLGGGKQVLFDAKAPMGGGIIGTIPYLLLNTAHIDQKNDGGNRLHRRWATALTKDLLCRNLPILKESEVGSFVRKNSKIGFRKKADCMNCHSTIDTMAAVIRNLENYNSGNVDIHYTIRNIYPHKWNKVHSRVLPDADENFYKTVPEGQFIHKDLFGKRIEKKINSLQDLGKELASTRDFFYCFSKRYFEFFTGIDINLEAVDWKQDKSDEIIFVQKISEELRRNQNIKMLITKIFTSPFYMEGL